MPGKLAAILVLGLMPAVTRAASDPRPALDFAARVAAQEAIERVYHAHRGSGVPFEEAFPRGLLERKVADSLRQSVALEQLWGRAATPETLEREIVRMQRDTQAPGVLRELMAALGHDPLLIEECLARPTWTRRVLEGFHRMQPEVGWDAQPAVLPFDRWWNHVRARFQPEDAVHVAAAAALPALSIEPDAACTPPDTWSYGSLDDALDWRQSTPAIWTGSEVLVWGGDVARGVRYDPALDVWTAMSTVNAPAPRSGFPAVWTGTELILDGGFDGRKARGDAAAYDPASDSWTVFAGSYPRSRHCLVWTGHEVVAWGGLDGASSTLTQGRRMDPATRVWTDLPSANQPAGRAFFACVWTGTEMIVYGGQGGGATVGGRFNPTTNSWTTMSAGPLAASDRGVWTGSEMLLWTGDASPGRPPYYYNPVSNSWRTGSATGGPQQHGRGESLLWTGSRLLVWGGAPLGVYSTTVYRLDPATGVWSSSDPPGAPAARANHLAAWLGDQMFVWGGTGSTFNATRMLPDGGRYLPGTDTWWPVAAPGFPVDPREDVSRTTVWTGSELLLWGGLSFETRLGTGARYEPATDAWQSLSTVGAPTPRFGHSAVWTGSRMLVWGGTDQLFLRNDGAAYDPWTDTWTTISVSGAPAARTGHSAVWTGSQMIVYGGEPVSFNPPTPPAGAGRYDPLTDTWAPINLAGAPAPRYWHSAVWGGDRMWVWGGRSSDTNNACAQGGGWYDPALDQWTVLPPTGEPPGKIGHVAVAAGARLLVWGGRPCDFSSSPGPGQIGAIFDPVSNAWTPMSTVNRPSARWQHAAVWTGSQVVLWGGKNEFAASVTAPWAFQDGSRYDPSTDQWTPIAGTGAPAPTYGHAAYFTGTDMLIWGGNNNGSGARYGITGGTDGDGDGTAACAGDCNDADGSVWATPGEARGLAWPSSKTELVWTPPQEPGATAAGLGFDTLRSATASDFGSAVCLEANGHDLSTMDPASPSPGTPFFYLVRAVNSCPAGRGPLGAGSDGIPRTGVPCP